MGYQPHLLNLQDFFHNQKLVTARADSNMALSLSTISLYSGLGPSIIPDVVNICKCAAQYGLQKRYGAISTRCDT